MQAATPVVAAGAARSEQAACVRSLMLYARISQPPRIDFRQSREARFPCAQHYRAQVAVGKRYA